MSYRFCALGVLGVSGLLASGASAGTQPILMTVNVADPVHVVFTTTSAFPQIGDTTRIPFGGILFTDLLAADYEMSSTVAPLTGNLAANGSVAFEVGLNGLIAGTRKQVNLFTKPTTAGWDVPYSLNTTSPAFVGSSVWDLTGFPAASFHAPGYVGNLHVGDADVAPVLGSYLVIVPEPTSLSLVAIAGVAMGRRRR